MSSSHDEPGSQVNQWEENVRVLAKGTGRLFHTAVHTVAELRQDRVTIAVVAEPLSRSVKVELLHLPVQGGAADAKRDRRLGDVAAGTRQRPQQGCLLRLDHLFLL